MLRLIGPVLVHAAQNEVKQFSHKKDCGGGVLGISLANRTYQQSAEKIYSTAPNISITQ